MLAERALRAALALSRETPQVREKARLELARFLLHCKGDTDAAWKLLQGIEEASLPAADRRLGQLCKGDVHLARGDVDAARKMYLQAGRAAEQSDVQYAVKRRMRIETARDYLKREEYDAVVDVMEDIERDTPLDRLNVETGLVVVKARTGRKEYPFAFWRCHRLLNAIPMNEKRADVLFELIVVSKLMERDDFAGETLKKLLDEHPYSEAAARAKDRWGAGVRDPG